MGRLTGVELRRYVAREGVRWLVVGMVAVVLLTGFAAWRSSRPATQAQLDQAQADYQLQLTHWNQFSEQMIADCRTTEQQARQNDPNVTFNCDQMKPTVEQFLPYRETFAGSAQGWLRQVGTFVLLLSLIVGATFVAAEFSTGAITTWLTFEPRRGPVFVSKSLVVTVVTGVAALLVSALAIGVFWAATAINHSTGDVTSQTFSDLGDQAGRIAAAAAAAALLGAGVGLLTPPTAPRIAVGVGWRIAIDGILLQSLLRAPRWPLTTNLQAWLAGGYEQGLGGTTCMSNSAGVTTCDGEKLVVTMTQAGVTIAVVLAVVTALAVLVFRRRDVA